MMRVYGEAPQAFYRGSLKSFSKDNGYGFIHCQKLQYAFGRDVYVHAAELPQGVSPGAVLYFSVALNSRGQPQALSVCSAEADGATDPAGGVTGAARPQADPAGSPDLEAADHVHHGVLKSFSAKHGYGFIVCQELRSAYGFDVYIHSAQLPAGASCGDELRFAVGFNARRQPQAHAVTLVDTTERDKMATGALLPHFCSFEECGPPRTAPELTARVVSWNTLARAYATASNFPDTDPAMLRWGRRAAQIRAVICRLQADVICLQEAEVELPTGDLGLDPDCYGFVVGRRPAGRRDGCIIAWRLARFSLLKESVVSFDDYLSPSAAGDDARFQTGHTAAIAQLQPHGSPPGRSMLVVTAHLVWGANSEDIRQWQLQVLQSAVEKFDSSCVVFCGDLNSLPGGQVYKYLSSKYCSAYEGLESGVVTNSNATAGDGFAETIDYCWLLRSGDAHLRRRIQLPTRDALRTMLGGTLPPAPVPTLVTAGSWPSDHLPVGVDVGLP